MKISNVYIGGWFQRTMLQLSEIYDFLRDCKTQLALDPEKLTEFRKNLEIGKACKINGLGYVVSTRLK